MAKIYICTFKNCSKAFNRPSRLQIHMRKHQGIKDFQCTHCGREYYRKNHLKRHIAEAHQKQLRLEQPLSCDHCGRNFKTAWGFRRHQLTIKNENLSRCQPYSCQICAKNFLTTNDLELHKLKHQRFKCDIPLCTWSTLRWSNYLRHISVKHSELLECEHCGKKFGTKSNLKAHIKKHMPKYICTLPDCKKTFIFNKNMKENIVMRHSGKNHKCNVFGCNWMFKYKICFKKHIKTHEQKRRIVPMANKIKRKNPKYTFAMKLATLCLRM